MGRCFLLAGPGNYQQPVRVGAIAYGNAAPEQWGVESRQVDFFDVKGDIEALLAPRVAEFRAAEHPALHPGKSAQIVLGGTVAGWLGELHPRWQRKYDLPLSPVLFELDYDVISERDLPAYKDVSRFPFVRRDISAEVDEEVNYRAILAGLAEKRPAIVTEISLFDIYRGSGVGKGRKSLAFRVLLQDTRKTLTEAEVESAVEALRQVLQQQFNAKLR
jgi:phenylalanyl-tRNA synthetase beta chain